MFWKRNNKDSDLSKEVLQAQKSVDIATKEVEDSILNAAELIKRARNKKEKSFDWLNPLYDSFDNLLEKIDAGKVCDNVNIPIQVTQQAQHTPESIHELEMTGLSMAREAVIRAYKEMDSADNDGHYWYKTLVEGLKESNKKLIEAQNLADQYNNSNKQDLN